MQQYFYDLGQQVMQRQHQSICLDNLNTRLFIIINSTYTLMRYMVRQPGLITRDEIASE